MEFPTRWIKIFKDIWGNKSRAMLVILSIAVGVAAIGMINNTMVMLSRDLFGSYPDGNPSSISIYISPFQKELSTAVEAMREVESAQARRTVSVTWVLPDGETQDTSLVAFPDFDHVSVNRYTIEEGIGSPGIREVVIERQGANAFGIQIGDTVTVKIFDDRLYTLTVVGIAHDLYALPYSIRDEATGYVSMATLEWMRQGSFYNQIDIVVADRKFDRAHVFDVAEMARDRVIEPAGYGVGALRIPGINAGPGQHWAQNSINGFTLVLQVMGVLAVFLSGGLVINTISAILSQQIRQIGIMRSVGAMRGQLIGMYLLNMVVYSMLGLLIGLPLGMFGAWRLTEFAAWYLNFDVSAVRPDPGVTLLQIAVGFLMPLGVAILPIIGGTRISVYDAIYQYGLASDSKDGLFDRAMSSLRNMHPPIMLSLRNTFRKKARLLFTLVTLTLAGAMFMSVFSTRASLTKQINEVSRYVAFDAALGVFRGVSRITAQREAQRIPGVTIAEAWVSGQAVIMNDDHTEGEQIQIIGVPYDTKTIEPMLVAGRWLQSDDTQQIVINDDLLEQQPDLQVGDRISIKVGDQEHPYEIVGNHHHLTYRAIIRTDRPKHTDLAGAFHHIHAHRPGEAQPANHRQQSRHNHQNNQDDVKRPRKIAEHLSLSITFPVAQTHIFKVTL